MSVTFVTNVFFGKEVYLLRKIIKRHCRTAYFCIVKLKVVFLSFLFVVTALFNSVRISFTYLHYYADPSGFIEKLCENKDRPELNCNGKCYLMKVLNQKKQSKEKPSEEITYKEITLFVEKAPEKPTFAVQVFDVNELPYYINYYSFLIGESLLDPPQASFQIVV